MTTRGSSLALCLAFVVFNALSHCPRTSAFQGGIRHWVLDPQQRQRGTCPTTSQQMRKSAADEADRDHRALDRTAFLRNAAVFIAAAAGTVASTPDSADAIGELFEFKDQARFASHATLQVSDMDAALKFWTEGVGMEVLRTRAGRQFNTTVVGFGPEALEQPPSFVPGVSSFQNYGGHFSLELNTQQGGGNGESEEESFFYEPGNGIQYLQIAADSYRISKVIGAGGVVESGYGHLQILVPGGLRLKLMSGSRRDPPMFVVYKVKNMEKSIKWYEDVAGMQQMPYPRARAPGSPFEPDQPKDSVFMAYEGEAFGVVLIPAARGEILNPGSAFSLAVLAEDVQKIGEEMGVEVDAKGGKGQTRSVSVYDPDGYAVKFIEYSDWRKELPRLV